MEMGRSSAWAAGMTCLVCLAYFSITIPYNSTSALEITILSTLNVTTEQLGVAFSAYSFAAVPLALSGGYFVDRFGLDATLMCATLVALLGSLLSFAATSPWVSSLAALCVGRVIFSFGSEPLYVVLDATIAFSVSPARQPLAYAIYMSTGRAADIVSYMVLPLPSFQLARFLSNAGAAFVLLVGGVSMIAMRRVVRARETARHVEQLEAELVGDYEKLLPRHAHDDDDDDDDAPVSFTQGLRMLPWVFWVACAISGVQLATSYVMIAYAPDYLHARYGLGEEHADFSSVILPAVALVTTVPIGLLLGLKALARAKGIVLVLSGVMLVTSFVIFGLTSNTAGMYCAIGLHGLGYAGTTAALYPAISFVTTKSTTGWGYGLAAAAGNAGALVLNYLIGHLLKVDPSATWATVALGVSSIVAVALSVVFAIGAHRRSIKK